MESSEMDEDFARGFVSNFNKPPDHVPAVTRQNERDFGL